MRISDSMLNNSFLSTINSNKETIDKLRAEISTSSKIQKPSDSPDGTVQLLGWDKQISQIDSYNNNINDAQSFVDDTTSVMQNIQSEVVNDLSTLTTAANSTNKNSLGNLADKIDQSLSAILDYANTKSGGKYIFGGTDYSVAPFSEASDGSSVVVNSSSISGEQKIRISQNAVQKINITGSELFGTELKLKGNLDNSNRKTSSISNTSTVYDAQGNAYNFNVSFSMIGTDKFNMTYNIDDGNGNTVLSTQNNSLAFDSTTGQLKTIDGNNPKPIDISVKGKNINFTFDPTSIVESNNPGSISTSLNQKSDIFNTLIQIRDSLKAGQIPSDKAVQIVNDFNSHILDKISEAGNYSNRLTNTQQFLDNRKLTLQDLMGKVQNVDIAQAVTDLQSQDYALQMSYKIASMTLNKSLLDYL